MLGVFARAPLLPLDLGCGAGREALDIGAGAAVVRVRVTTAAPANSTVPCQLYNYNLPQLILLANSLTLSAHYTKKITRYKLLCVRDCHKIMRIYRKSRSLKQHIIIYEILARHLGLCYVLYTSELRYLLCFFFYSTTLHFILYILYQANKAV